MTRRLARFCTWIVILAAACSTAVVPTATPSSVTRTTHATPGTTPTTVVFTRGRVEMGDDFYAPQELTVVVGATVTWQITGWPVPLERSHVPRRGHVHVHVCSPPGEYNYLCSFHLAMTGKIIVK